MRLTHRVAGSPVQIAQGDFLRLAECISLIARVGRKLGTEEEHLARQTTTKTQHNYDTTERDILLHGTIPNDSVCSCVSVCVCVCVCLSLIHI